MKSATKRLVSLLASLGILAASIFVYTLFLSPAYDKVNELRGELQARQDILEDQRRISEQVKNLLQENQSITVLRETISRAIPGSEDYPGLVSQISGLANAAQLRLESVSMNPLSNNAIVSGQGTLPDASILQVTVGATGSYAALKDFLSSLERNIRITDLVSLGISAPSSGVAQNFSFNIVLNSYYQSL